MPESAAQVSDRLQKSIDRLTGTIDKLSGVFTDFRTDVSAKLGAIHTSLGVAKWAGGLLAVAAISAFGIATGMAYRAGETNKTILNLEKAVLESQQEAKTRDAQIVKIMTIIESMERRYIATPSPVQSAQPSSKP